MKEKRILGKTGIRQGSEGEFRFFVNRKVKDRLFRYLFSQDREALLQLYNGLNGTDYTDPSQLEIVTVDNIVYLSMKNDLAFILSGVLNLYEHQSTYNPNMPLRCFLYLGQEYQKLLARRQEDLYGSTLVRLPTPQCVVFYNGNREEPDERMLRLSDAFERRDKDCGVEVTVRLLNINFGHNGKLMDQCRRLWEYAYFINQIKSRLNQGMPVKAAVDGAVMQCMEEGVLAGFLEEHRMEVMGMLLTEYNEKRTMKFLRREAMKLGREEGREEGRQEGRQEGREEGIIAGITEGEQRFADLTQKLMEAGRLEDLRKAAAEPAYRERLFRELGL